MTKPAARKRELDPYTLRVVAVRLGRERKCWLRNPGGETYYGSGFRDGMAEMARRTIVDCRERAKAAEKPYNPFKLTPVATLCGPVPKARKKGRGR